MQVQLLSKATYQDFCDIETGSRRFTVIIVDEILIPIFSVFLVTGLLLIAEALNLSEVAVARRVPSVPTAKPSTARDAPSRSWDLCPLS